MRRSATSIFTWRLVGTTGDVAIGVMGFFLAFVLRIYLPLPLTVGLLPESRIAFFFANWVPITLSQVLGLYFFGFYDPPRPRARVEVLRRLLAATGLQGLALMGYYFLTGVLFPRSVLLLFIPLNTILLFAWRTFVQRLHRPPQRRVAIVGSGEAAQEVARNINQYHWHGLRVMGHVPAPVAPGAPLAPVAPAAPDHEPVEDSNEIGDLGPCLGTVDQLPGFLQRDEIDDIILAHNHNSWQTELIDGLARLKTPHGSVFLLPGPFESLIGRMRYRWIYDTPLIEVVRDSEWRLNWPLKRLTDLVVGSLLFVLSLPVMAICALAIRITSLGPILYPQRRVGRGQQPFTLFKFRTMRQDAEQGRGEMLAQEHDPRLTSIGGFLRRFRLDELPQLANVLSGSMSLVGPRPERPGFVNRYMKEVPGYVERFPVAPGLTGLAQVNGHYHSSPQNKLRYDLAYISNWSLWLDFSILFRTVKIVLTSRGT